MIFGVVGRVLFFVALFSVISPPRFLGIKGRRKAVTAALIGCAILIVTDDKSTSSSKAVVAVVDATSQKATQRDRLTANDDAHEADSRRAEQDQGTSKTATPQADRAKDSDLGVPAADFHLIFNDYSDSKLRAAKGVCASSIRTSCQIRVTPNVGLIAAADNGSTNAKEIIVIFPNKAGGVLGRLEGLLACGIVINILSPSASAKERGDLMNSLLAHVTDEDPGEVT